MNESHAANVPSNANVVPSPLGQAGTVALEFDEGAGLVDFGQFNQFKMLCFSSPVKCSGGGVTFSVWLKINGFLDDHKASYVLDTGAGASGQKGE